VAVEHAIWLCRNGQGQVDGARAVAAAGVMDPEHIDVVADSVLTQIFVPEPPWRASELLFLEQKFPGEMLPRLFFKALLKEEWSEPLAGLIGAVLARASTAPDSPEVLMARLRLMATKPWAVGHPGEVQAQSDWILNTAVMAVTAVQGRLEQVELTALVLKAAVIAVANPRHRVELPREVRNVVSGYGAVQADGVVDFLHGCVDSQVLGQAEIEELTRLAIVTTPGYPGRDDVQGDFLSDVTVFAGSERLRLLEVPIRHAVRTGRTDPQSMCDSILTKNWNQTFNTASERLVEKVYEERQKFSREWWKRLRQEAGPTELDPSKPARFGGFMSAMRKDR
jgi:hypothetical protein